MHHDLDIDVIRTSPGEYRVRLRSAAAGEAVHVVRWPWRDLELENRLKDLQIALLRAGGKRRKALTPEEETVQRFGRELFDMLFAGEGLVLYRRSAEHARQARVGLRIRLHLDDPPLAALPWEFLYDAAHDDYLCLSTQTPVLRYLDVGQPVAPLTVTAPLRVLGVVASPVDLEPLDVDLERQRVETALAGLVKQGLVELVWLEGQTWRDWLRTLRRGAWHVVHFIGHGGFDPHRDEGVLWLADDAGRARALHASELARLLADHADLRLVLLNACESARPGALDIFSSTATALVRRGLPAVIAMQYEITDRAAIEFARSLYEALADGMPIDSAVSEARRSVKLEMPHSIEWGTPVLHLRATDGRLFEIDALKNFPPAKPTEPEDTTNKGISEGSQGAQQPQSGVFEPTVTVLPREQPQRTGVFEPTVTLGLAPEVERALAILTDWEHFPPEIRLKAGDFLGAEPGRDPRPGVGLRPDGLPDIDWVEIPERDANGRREFIYQENERRIESTFWIARYPITYLQFQAFVDAVDGFPDTAWRKELASFPSLPEQRFTVWNRPRDRVWFHHAVAFCRWMTAKVQQAPDLLPVALRGWRGVHFAVPTEWQWEKAARGWHSRLYPWGEQYLVGYANVNEFEQGNGLHFLEQSSPVGMYPQGMSLFGVLDLSGNVWEWCLNEFEKPMNTSCRENVQRVLRGSSWYHGPQSAAANTRVKPARGGAPHNWGFRVVVCASP